MNPDRCQVVLRPRGPLEVFDLGWRLMRSRWQGLARLAALLLPLPIGGTTVLSWWLDGAWWLLPIPILLGAVVRVPFTLAGGKLLFASELSVLDVMKGTARALPVLAAHWAIRLLATALGLPFLLFAQAALLYQDETALLERVGPARGIRRSVRLATGHFGIALAGAVGTLALLVWFAAVAEGLGQFLVGFVFQLGAPFGTVWGGMATPYLLAGLWVAQPVIAIYRLLLYVDVRTRIEGWDLQVGLLAAGEAMIALLLLLACGEPTASEPTAPESGLDASYRFCHEPGVYGSDAQDFCGLLDELPEDVCPGMRASCAGEAETVVPSGCQPGASGPPSREFMEGPEPPTDPMKCERPEDLDGLATVVRWVVALLVALLVLIFLRVVWFFIGRMRSPRGEAEVLGSSVDEPESPPSEELPDVPALPSPTLLQKARAALEAGKTGEAAELARGAALRRLGDEGRLQLHRATTDREYVSRLGRGEEADALGDVVQAVEIHRWGGSPLTSERARRAVEAVSRLLGMLVLLLVALPAHGQSAWRYSPRGDAALSEVLAASGYSVSWRLRPLSDLDDETDVLVLDLSGVSPSSEDWEAVRAWVETGGVLWLAGGNEAIPELGDILALEGGLDTRLGPDWMETDLAAPRWSEGPRTAFSTCPVPWVEAVGVEDPKPPHWDTEDLLPLSPGERAGVVCAAPVQEGLIIGVSDERLLWNGALIHPNNRRFVGDLLVFARNRHGLSVPDPVRVQLATTSSVGSSGADNPIGALANARLLPFVLQLLVFWLLLALWRGLPFGPLRDPPGMGRQRFADHAVALGNRYRRLGARAWAWHVYARYWWGRLGEVGLRSAARREGWPDEKVDDFLDAVRDAAETPPDGARSDFETTMEDLWTMTR